MPEIDNSLAASVKPLDVGGALAKAAQLREATINADLGQQKLQHNEREYGENAGLTSGERSTMSKTQQEAMGPIGNILANDQSPQARQQAISLAKRAGIPMDDMTAGHLMSAPPDQIKQYGVNAQRLGQSSSSNIEQSGLPAGNTTREAGRYHPYAMPENAPVISQTEAATGGRKVTQAQVDGAIKSGRNFDGSPRVLSTADIASPIPPSGIVKNPDGSISSNVTPETTSTQKSLAEDYGQYKESAKNAAMTKYVLKNMADDADRLSTGKGATFTNNVKQWLQSAQTLPGVGSAVKSITGDISDPIAAFEALQKNAGQLTRATLKDVDGKAASEYSMIQKQLPNAEMSPRGLKLVTAQMMAPEDFKQAKLQAADRWKSSNNGSLAGFEGEWNKNISPSTFLFARLPPQERDALVKNLSKTDAGKAQLSKIKREAVWAHKSGLDEFVD
jgi:hypothetical protein